MKTVIKQELVSLWEDPECRLEELQINNNDLKSQMINALHGVIVVLEIGHSRSLYHKISISWQQ